MRLVLFIVLLTAGYVIIAQPIYPFTEESVRLVAGVTVAVIAGVIYGGGETNKDRSDQKRKNKEVNQFRAEWKKEKRL